MKNKSRIQICPQCGSSNIQPDFSNAGAITRGFMATVRCNNCGHEGTFFPTIEKTKLKKSLKPKKIKNVQYLDTTFAKGIFTITVFASFLICALAGTFMLFYPSARDVSLFLFSISLISLAILIIKTRRKDN